MELPILGLDSEKTTLQVQYATERRPKRMLELSLISLIVLNPAILMHVFS